MNASLLAWLSVYAVACLAIGLIAARRIRHPDDWFVAGRSLGAWVLGLSLFASTVTGFAFIGGPALVLRFGTSSLWMLITGPLGAGLVFWLLARPLSKCSRERGLWSLPEVLGERYASPCVAFVATIALLVGVVLYLGVQILAFEQVVRALWPSVPPFVPLATGALVLGAYASAGGTLASVWTDALQGALMIAASVLLLVVIGGLFAEGESLGTVLAKRDPHGSGPFGSHGPTVAWGWYLVFALGNVGQPHIIRNLMFARSERAIRRALPLVILGGTLGAALWLGVGLALRALVLSGREAMPADPDAAALVFLTGHVPVWLAGLVLAGLLAAIMSSADALLNQGAIALVHDLPRAFGRPALARPVRAARWASLTLLVAATAFALCWRDLLAFLGVLAWGLFAAVFVPALGIGLNWTHAHKAGAIASIAGSLLGALAIRTGLIPLPQGLRGDELLLLASLIVFLLVSLVAHAFSKSRPRAATQTLDLRVPMGPRSEG